jgi:hypothetical protein
VGTFVIHVAKRNCGPLSRAGSQPRVGTRQEWELYDVVAGGIGDNFEINYLDPNFKLPSDWKFAVGVTYQVDESLVLQSDLL